MDLSERASSRNTRESRSTPFDGAELRSTDGGNTLTFTGYASVFNRSYQVSDMFGPFSETVAPGAFRDSLAQGADVPFLLNHSGMTLARTKSGTMNLAEDSHGLHVEARLDPANPQVQALRSAMERKDIDEMSFGFYVVDDTWSDDWMSRTLNAVDINKGDVSAVNYGANPYTAGAKLRSADLVRALRSVDDLDEATRAALLRELTVSNVEVEGSAEATSDQLDIFRRRLRALSL